MIAHWCEALGDRNPVYTDPEAAARSVHGGLVAPPTMMQAWVLKGFAMADADAEPEGLQEELHALLSSHGYTGVIATNCDQGYTRYLRPGDRVEAVMTIESVSEEKATAVGTGYFIETRTSFRDQHGEEVGWMTFRVLKFKPGPQQQAAASSDDGAPPPRPGRIRPPLSQDVAWWWERVAQGHIPIQRCSACGTLRHPPRPMCGKCQSMEWDAVDASGRGQLHSWVVLHHPPLPGYELPMRVGLVDLEEGTRLVANLEGVSREDVRIGMPLQAHVEEVDDTGFKAPVFRPVE